MALLSVCIPAYKNPETLKHALHCLQIQTFRDFEVIVTDDSPNNSVENVIRSIDFPADIPLHYFRNNPALGTPENWNEAMRKANGDFILLHHHDDWLTQAQSLEKLIIPLLHHPQAGFSFGMVDIFDTQSQKLLYRNTLTAEKRKILETQPEQLTVGNFIGPPTAVLFRRNEKLWFDSKIKWLVDTDFFIRLVRLSPVFEYVPEPLVGIGIHETQVTKSVLKDKNLLLYEYFYEAEKFRIDLQQQPFLDAYGNWLWKLKVKSYSEISQLGLKTDFSEPVEKMLKRRKLYRFRQWYVRLVMFVKYDFLKLKRNFL